jgi:hypothetical protein
MALTLLAGCSTSGGSSSSVPRPSPTPTAKPTPTAVANACSSNVISASIGAAGGALSKAGTTGTFTETFAAAALTKATTVSLGYFAQANLPAPLDRFRHVADGSRTPQFTAGAGNTYVVGLCTSFGGATPVTAPGLSGTGIVPSTIPAGTQLNIAYNENGTWTDVGTALVGASGSFQSTPPTLTLPGITQAGNYLVYLPASGTNTAQINLGFALIGDDGSGQLTNGLQFVQVENSSGVAVPTPTTTFFPITSAPDLDGQALTPDANEGTVVDGSNTVYFFSGIPQHNVVISPTTVDITAYGGDGDSIANLPSGDEAVASGNGTQLAVISGILAGTPVVADTIDNANGTYDRDGMVLSNDGKVLLSRGASGIDIFSIAKVAPHAGSTGQGTTSYDFTLTQTLTSGTSTGISTPFFEDGRDEMALSPTDSSRAVVGGESSAFTPEIQLITGLPSGKATVQALQLRLPAFKGRRPAVAREEPSHRLPQALTPTVGTDIYAVSITPDGTTAYVSTDAGILTISGVKTGTLSQVGGAYAPVITVPGGNCTVEGATSIGVLPDGKYLVADVPCLLTAPNTNNTTQGTTVLVTIPIGAGGALGTPVGQLNNVVGPFNDQILFH